MKVLLIISITLALAQGDENILQKFRDFKLKYKKSYRSLNEEVERLNIFQANLAEIEAHNNGRSSYTKGINQFTDLTKEEFKGFIHPEYYEHMYSVNRDETMADLDMVS